MDKLKSIEENPLIGSSFTPGTSVAMHVNHSLAKLTMSVLENLIKDNSELTLAVWRVLLTLHLMGTSSQKDIVQFSWLDQAQASRALKLLKEKGLVRSEESSQDKRSRLFSITENGEKYRQTLQPIVDEFHQRLTDCLTEEEIQLYISINAKIANAAVKKFDQP